MLQISRVRDTPLPKTTTHNQDTNHQSSRMAPPILPPSLEDPFTGPPSAPRASTTAPTRRGANQSLRALSQTFSSRLNSIRQSTGSNSKMRSSSLALRKPPVMGQIRNFSMPTAVSSSPVLSSSPSIGMIRQRSFSGDQTLSHRPSVRSNVRQSSVPAGLVPAVHPSVQQDGQLGMMAVSQMLPAASINTLSQHINFPAATHNLVVLPVTQQTPVRGSTGVVNDDLEKSPIPAVHHQPAQQPPPAPFLSRFTLFSGLPQELQNDIWSIAVAVQHHTDKRFLRVAPDSESLDRTTEDAEVAQLRIISDIHRRPRLVPSLLHACQYSRQEAIKGYELWGCADPVTCEKNGAKVYVKPGIDTFFFGDADLGNFWVLDTLIKESTSETAAADDIARTNFFGQLGLIKHYTFDYELWVQLLEYDAIWLANLDSADQLTVAIRNPNHEELDKDYALCYMRQVTHHTLSDESARIVLGMTHRALTNARHDLLNLNWPPTGGLDVNIKTMSMGSNSGNTAEDETYLEDVLIEGNRTGLITDQYLKARLAMLHQRAIPPPPPPAPAPIMAPAN